MSTEIEIEKKNLLTEDEYNSIYSGCNLDGNQSFTQENTYFDTKGFALKKVKSALRIRTKRNFAEITLKTPHNENLLEINEAISLDEAKQIIFEEKLTPRNEVKKKLINLGFSTDITLYLLAKLTTQRIEKKLDNGLLVLDKTWYGNNKDYELEIEARTTEDADKLFNNILDHFSIPKRNTPNKISRAFAHLNPKS